MQKKQILLVNDMPGVGRVALSASIPIFSSMGYFIQTLPTAIVSNTLDFGIFEILDTTDYMEKTVDVWKKLGFKFDCITTGFLATNKQVSIIERLIYENTKENPFIVVDPIMADNGNLYNGIDNSHIDIMRSLCKNGNIITPNMTEAFMLTGCYHSVPRSISKEDCKDLVNNLRSFAKGSIVITSLKLNNTSNSYVIAGWDNSTQDYFSIPYNHIDTHFPGTGDVFSSVLTGAYLNGCTLEKSIIKAKDFVSATLQNPKTTQDKRAGLFIEEYLHLL